MKNKKLIEKGHSGIRVEVKSIAQKSGVYFIGQAATRAVGFLMIPVYTRFIVPAQYGAMELIEIIASGIAILVAMNISDGMSRYYYNENDQDRRDEVVSTIYIGLGSCGIPIVLIFLVFSPFIATIISTEPEHAHILNIAIISTWFALLCDIGYSYLRMVYRAKTFVVMTLAQLLIALSLNIYFIVYQGIGILGIFYSTLIAQGLTGITLAYIILSKIGFRFSFSKYSKIIKFGLPLIPSRLGVMFGLVSNRFFLRWAGASDPLNALSQVGLFSLGQKFGVLISSFFLVPFHSYWDPRRMELLLSDVSDSKNTVSRVSTYAIYGVVYLTLFICAGVEDVIKIMADPAYYGAHVVTPFVAAAYVIFAFERNFIAGIYFSEQTKPLVFISIIGVAVVLLWNYIFVPKYGLIGAATSNLIGHIVRTSLIYRISQRLFYIPYEIRRLATILIVAIVLYLITQYIELASPYLNLLARLSAVSLFPVLLYFVGFYTQGEIKTLIGVLKNLTRKL